MKLNRNRSLLPQRASKCALVFSGVVAIGLSCSFSNDSARAQGQTGFDQQQQQGFPPPQQQQGFGQQPGGQPGGNIPAPVRQMINGQPLAPGQGPIVVPPITFVDLNSGKFGKLEIDLEDGQFMDGSAKNIHLIARNLDLREGVLKSLDLLLVQGNIQDFIVDKLTLTTQGAMRFDTGVLLNQKMLQFVEPTQADVTCEISQESLNKFINSPNTLERLSMTANKKAGVIANLFGGNAPSIGLSVSSGQLVLGKGNRLDLKFDSRIGMGQMAMAIPVEVTSKLALTDGWVTVTDTKVMTSGQEISPSISEWLVKKVNGLSAWGMKNDDIHFRFTDLKVKPGKGFILKGTAEVNRLRFGRQ